MNNKKEENKEKKEPSPSETVSIPENTTNQPQQSPSIQSSVPLQGIPVSPQLINQLEQLLNQLPRIDRRGQKGNSIGKMQHLQETQTLSVPTDFLLNDKLLDKLEQILEHADKTQQRHYEVSLKEIEINKELNLKHLNETFIANNFSKKCVIFVIGMVLIFILLLILIVGINNLTFIKEIMGILQVIVMTGIGIVGAFYYGKCNQNSNIEKNSSSNKE